MSNSDLIHGFFARHNVPLAKASNESIVFSIEESIDSRLPSLYREFIAGYAFHDVTLERAKIWGPLGDSEAEFRTSQSERVRHDEGLFHTLKRNGYVQIGRPTSGGRDAVCIKFSEDNPPVIRVDYEKCLLQGEIAEMETVAFSLRDLLLS